MTGEKLTKWKTKPKVIHRARKIREDGAVSAACFATPRPINLQVATWTIRDDAVTCRKCIEARRAGKANYRALPSEAGPSPQSGGRND